MYKDEQRWTNIDPRDDQRKMRQLVINVLIVSMNNSGTS